MSNERAFMADLSIFRPLIFPSHPTSSSIPSLNAPVGLDDAGGHQLPIALDHYGQMLSLPFLDHSPY